MTRRGPLLALAALGALAIAVAPEPAGLSPSGAGTLVGSPPNTIVAAQIERGLGVEVSFVDWLLVGVPVVVLALPVLWVVVCRLHPPEPDTAVTASAEADRLRRELGPVSATGKRVAAVFAATALL